MFCCLNEESLIAKFDDKSNNGVQIVQNGLVKHNNNDSKRYIFILYIFVFNEPWTLSANSFVNQDQNLL